MISITQGIEQLRITGKVGVVYDARCERHQLSKHFHQETPKRLQAVLQTVRKYEGEANVQLQVENDVFLECLREVSEIESDKLERVYSQEQIEHLNTFHRNKVAYKLQNQEQEEKYTTGQKEKLSPSALQEKCYWLDEDCYVNADTHWVARLSAQIGIEAVERVLQSQWGQAFAICRPPGHHSSAKSGPAGFCFYNNVAVAVRHLQALQPGIRIAVLDWDVHQGDGTMQILREDKDVLFLSLHRYDEGSFYPCSSQQGGIEDHYDNPMMVNVPIDKSAVDVNQLGSNKRLSKVTHKVGDSEYVFLYDRVVAPLFKAFQPDLILVSAGFDAAQGDPLGELQVDRAFGYILTRLLQIQQKAVLFLEGGYNLKALKVQTKQMMDILLQQHDSEFYSEMHAQNMPSHYIQALAERVLEHHRAHWKALGADSALLDGVRTRFYQEVAAKSLSFFSEGGKLAIRGEEREDDTQVMLQQSLERHILSTCGQQEIEGQSYLLYDYSLADLKQTDCFLLLDMDSSESQAPAYRIDLFMMGGNYIRQVQTDLKKLNYYLDRLPEDARKAFHRVVSLFQEQKILFRRVLLRQRAQETEVLVMEPSLFQTEQSRLDQQQQNLVDSLAK